MQPAAFGATVVTDRPAEVAAFYAAALRPADHHRSRLVHLPSPRRRELGAGHHPARPRVGAGRGLGAPESTNVFGFIVDDVDKIAAALVEAGVELETEPVTEVWGQRHFFVRDPEGTWLDVIQLVAPDPEWLAANFRRSRQSEQDLADLVGLLEGRCASATSASGKVACTIGRTFFAGDQRPDVADHLGDDPALVRDRAGPQAGARSPSRAG